MTAKVSQAELGDWVIGYLGNWGGTADNPPMRTGQPGRLLLVALCLGLSPAVAGAQMYEIVGTRAQGMAGAFVAVADDATATWWNPAGIGMGALLGVSLEHTDRQAPAGDVGVGPAAEQGVNGFALTVPSLGLSYYRLRISEIAPLLAPTASSGAGRETEGAATLRTMVLNQFGATFGQSLGSHLVLASTVRLLQGGRASGATLVTASGAVGAADSVFDEADDLEIDGEFAVDLDLGVIARVGGLRLGGSLRHLREPTFGEGATAFLLERQARVGAAWMGGQHGLVSAWTVAFDTDVTETPTVLGPARHMAGGGELWLWNRRIGVRGGYSANTVGAQGKATSVGLSLAPRATFFIDGALTRGEDDTLEGWAAALRLTF